MRRAQRASGVELLDAVGAVQPLAGGLGLRRVDHDAGGGLAREELDHVEARARRAEGLRAAPARFGDGAAVHALDDQVAQLLVAEVGGVGQDAREQHDALLLVPARVFVAVDRHQQPRRGAPRPVAPGGEVGARQLLEHEPALDHVVGPAAVDVGRHRGPAPAASRAAGAAARGAGRRAGPRPASCRRACARRRRAARTACAHKEDARSSPWGRASRRRAPAPRRPASARRRRCRAAARASAGCRSRPARVRATRAAPGW